MNNPVLWIKNTVDLIVQESHRWTLRYFELNASSVVLRPSCFLFSYFNQNPIIMSEIWSMACFCLWYSSSPFWGLIVPQFAPNRRLITEYRLDWNKLMAIISHKSESIPSLSQKDAKPISKNKTTISKTFIFICEIIFNVLIGKKFVECNYWCI